MRQIKFAELITALYNALVNDEPTNFNNIYLKDEDENFHKVIQVDLMGDRFRCRDGYWDGYNWIMQDDTRLYVD